MRILQENEVGDLPIARALTNHATVIEICTKSLKFIEPYPVFIRS